MGASQLGPTGSAYRRGFATLFATAPWLRAAAEGAPPFTGPLTSPPPSLRPPGFAQLLSREPHPLPGH